MARTPRTPAEPKPRRRTAPRRGTSPAASPEADAARATAAFTVRHYCQGIGDCHLLRFPREDGGSYFMLIDCGVHSGVSGGADKVREIVADIASVTKRIDLLVVTHEHWDHVSGFTSAAAAFGGIHVEDVWFGWTEDPDDPLARELDEYKGQALAALQAASSRLAGLSGGDAHLGALRQGLSQILGFYFGAAGDNVRKARNAARRLAKGKVSYQQPGAGPLALPGVAGIKIYVLGPPRDAAAIGLEERASELYGHGLAGGRGMAMAKALLGCAGGADAFAEDESSPFDPEFGKALSEVLPLAGGSAAPKTADLADASSAALVELLHAHYSGPALAPTAGKAKAKPAAAVTVDQSWRRIDGDWLGLSADLAMRLDKGVNNTSLVLAFEFGNRRIALFVGDAQVGNWLSWHDLKWEVNGTAVTGPDLMKRTVYLKVGHHGSHNATLKAKGLELMNDPDLSAFIPVNEADAKKIGWREMPFTDILGALKLRAGARVVRADEPWLADGAIPPALAQGGGSLQAVRCKPKLWVEFDIR
ncbi:MBL fold metallo-hydrolase [Bosea sp. BH3]|uniref:MBL fold metallo-hydrolase n=1 Tax=Bosea sp. BH3 TaxID=2871701 RepID=UPI0021CB4D9C|nr:MBL fold metallo-hydrolase [Bosea sp. BH3]MCU4179714.1 MBL fold metallo-hydrolase [Bosea sp. BH3]